MPTTKNLLARLTFSAGLGLTVIAGGAVAAGAAPPDPGDAIDTHPPFEVETDAGLVVEEPTFDAELDVPYPLVDVTDFFEPDPESDESTRVVIPEGEIRAEPLFGDGELGGRIPVPDDVIAALPTPEDDPEVGSGPTVDIEDCSPVAACPSSTPGDIPDETPGDIPEETPDTDPIVPTNKGSLPYTGAGSIVLAAIGTGIAGVGVAAHRFSRRNKH